MRPDIGELANNPIVFKAIEQYYKEYAPEDGFIQSIVEKKLIYVDDNKKVPEKN